MATVAPFNTDFEAGDTVECVEDSHYQFMVLKGQQYKIKAMRRSTTGAYQIVMLEYSPLGIYGSRFKLVKPAKPTHMQFTKGQKLTVIDAEFCGHTFTKGEVVTFERYGDDKTYVTVSNSRGGLYSGWRANRFAPVTPTLPVRLSNQPNNTKPMQTHRHNHRDSIGRFASTRLQRSIAAASQPTAPALNLPLVLRPGALYRIVGGGVGHYVGQVKGFAVLKVHGKPVTVEVARVVKADKADVDAYLADAKLNK